MRPGNACVREKKMLQNTMDVCPTSDNFCKTVTRRKKNYVNKKEI